MRTQPFVPPPPPKKIITAAPSPAALAPAPAHEPEAAPAPAPRAQAQPPQPPAPVAEQTASPLQVLEQVLLKQLAPAQNLSTGLRLESDLFVFIGTRNEPEQSPLLACLYLGLLDTRQGKPWELHTTEGMPLLVMNEQRELDGDPDYVRFFQRFERLMLLEHLTTISVTLKQLRDSVPDNARKADVLALMDKEVIRIDQLLSERFK